MTDNLKKMLEAYESQPRYMRGEFPENFALESMMVNFMRRVIVEMDEIKLQLSKDYYYTLTDRMNTLETRLICLEEDMVGCAAAAGNTFEDADNRLILLEKTTKDMFSRIKALEAPSIKPKFEPLHKYCKANTAYDAE